MPIEFVHDVGARVVRSGEALRCPECGEVSFTISRRDPRVGQCYSMLCGLRSVIGRQLAPVPNIYFDLYKQFHTALLNDSNLLLERGVQQLVVAHSMVGMIPDV